MRWTLQEYQKVEIINQRSRDMIKERHNWDAGLKWGMLLCICLWNKDRQITSEKVSKL